MGDILIAGTDEKLSLIGLPLGSEKQKPQPSWVHDPEAFAVVGQQITEYFEGRRQTFDLPLAFEGTAFQKMVWQALQNIPFGQTVSYFELACRIGRPSASRAVGSANARNPLPIILPCHRVVGKNGALTGYAGGLRWKEKLLRMEGALPAETDTGS
jgi:methylated-DNA-[protein]-cysteine S-methyltransferase